MPRAVPQGLSEKLRQRLRSEGPLSFETLVAGAGAPKDSVRAALQLECLRGRVLYDVARGTYRPRELMPTPVDEASIRFGNEQEARAHRLLGDGGPGAGEVKVTKVHEVVGEGTPHPRRGGGPRGRAQLLPQLHAGPGGPREGRGLRLPALPPLGAA